MSPAGPTAGTKKQISREGSGRGGTGCQCASARVCRADAARKWPPPAAAGGTWACADYVSLPNLPPHRAGGRRGNHTLAWPPLWALPHPTPPPHTPFAYALAVAGYVTFLRGGIALRERVWLWT